MKASHCLWVALLLLFAGAGEVLAQTNVESRVQKLEETIGALERRVAALEGLLREQNTPAPVASDKINWRKLQKGMSESDVQKLLGSPSKVDVYGTFTIWHYGELTGANVQFDGKSRTVSGWHEP